MGCSPAGSVSGWRGLHASRLMCVTVGVSLSFPGRRHSPIPTWPRSSWVPRRPALGTVSEEGLGRQHGPLGSERTVGHSRGLRPPSGTVRRQLRLHPSAEGAEASLPMLDNTWIPHGDGSRLQSVAPRAATLPEEARGLLRWGASSACTGLFPGVGQAGQSPSPCLVWGSCCMAAAEDQRCS